MEKIKQKELEKKLKFKRKILAQNVDFRRKEWLDKVANNQEFQKFYKEGAIKLAHPDLIEFRERDKKQEKSHKTILAYRYQPDRAKSLAVLEQYKSGHLKKENYDSKSPNRNTDWLRPRIRDSEINPKLRYSIKAENERLDEYLKSTSKINAEPLDTNMLYNTPYREFKRESWVSDKQFNVYKGHKQRQWSETKIAADTPEPYLEAFREIERVRNSSRELSQSPFSASLPQDTWGDRVNKSTSIRSYMGIIGALKSASPTLKIDPKRMKTVK